MSDEGSRSVSRSPSATRKRSPSRSYSRSPSYSRGRRHSYSPKKEGRKGSYRSRSNSPSDDDRDDRRGGRRRSRSRSPFSHRKRHKGDRERPTTSRCLGVFGLSLRTEDRDLREVFSRYGPIEQVTVVYDHQTGRSRGFAFLYFEREDDAIEAKERLTGYELDGRNIRVDYSITERAHTPTPGIYLGRPTTRPSRGRYGGGGGDRYSDRDRYGDRYDRYGDRGGDRYGGDKYGGDRYGGDRYGGGGYGGGGGGGYGGRGYRDRSPSPYYSRRYSRSRSRSYSPRRY